MNQTKKEKLTLTFVEQQIIRKKEKYDAKRAVKIIETIEAKLKIRGGNG